MRRLQRLINANKYFRSFRPAGLEDVDFSLVVDQDNAVSVLSRASGDQVLISFPEEYEQWRNSDSFSSRISVAIFVITKINSAARTQKLTEESFDRMLEISQKILDSLADDLSSSHCNLLSGMDLSSVNTVPEYSIFGGWSGYSIELTFE